MHVLIQRHSGHTGHKATHWGGEEGRAGDSLEPIKLFYGNQESMKLLYEAMALQVWTSYRFSHTEARAPSQGIPGDPCPRCKDSCPNPPGFWVQGVATVWGGTWSHAPVCTGWFTGLSSEGFKWSLTHTTASMCTGKSNFLCNHLNTGFQNYNWI